MLFVLFIMGAFSLMKTLYQFMLNYWGKGDVAAIPRVALVSLGISLLFHFMVMAITVWPIIL